VHVQLHQCTIMPGGRAPVFYCHLPLTHDVALLCSWSSQAVQQTPQFRQLEWCRTAVRQQFGFDWDKSMSHPSSHARGVSFADACCITSSSTLIKSSGWLFPRAHVRTFVHAGRVRVPPSREGDRRCASSFGSPYCCFQEDLVHTGGNRQRRTHRREALSYWLPPLLMDDAGWWCPRMGWCLGVLSTRVIH
jgi:hypothetical protein